MDLRHLAVILDVGAKAARELDDPALHYTLAQMCEVATVFALHPDGGTMLPLDELFAPLAERLQ